MIFYVLQGPSYLLEIHDDKLILKKKGWWQMFTREPHRTEWELDSLSQFDIAVPKLVWGKLAWQSTDGVKGTFRFTTNAKMVRLIEKYMQKRIIKNHQKKSVLVATTVSPVVSPLKKDSRKSKKDNGQAA